MEMKKESYNLTQIDYASEYYVLFVHFTATGFDVPFSEFKVEIINTKVHTFTLRTVFIATPRVIFCLFQPTASHL